MNNSTNISFWSCCTSALEAMNQNDWHGARTFLNKAKVLDSVAPSNSQRSQSRLLQRYLEMLASCETAAREAHTQAESRLRHERTSVPVRLSLVTTVFNRLLNLRQTLPKNLDAIRGQENIELVLIDFGGSDSPAIAEFIESEFSFELLTGQLRYFRRTVSWQRFHMAPAKNAAHRLARGEIIFSVDADNLVLPSDVTLVLEHFDRFPDSVLHQTIGPAPLAHSMWRQYSVFQDGTQYHDEELAWDGSCGRIAISRANFEKVNGYNETFVGMGMDDVDFLLRSIKTGRSYHHYRIERPSNEIIVDDTTSSKEHEHGENQRNWKLMDESLKDNRLIPSYVTDSPPEAFVLYQPQCVKQSATRTVTLFTSVFQGGPYLERLLNDIREILDSHKQVMILLLDVVASHSSATSEALRKLAEHKQVFYAPVRRDPGLYQLWNVAIRNIESEYVGNLNIDDLRGPGWLPACLDPLESNLADIVSPVTVPFSDQSATSHAAAIGELRRDGKREQRWFETSVHVRGSGRDATIEHVSLVDGQYDQGNLFQVLPDNTLSSYCIPNASAIWRRKLHDRVGYFDEQKYGCYADLALWAAAGAAGMRFRQVNYPALFFISEHQAHRRQLQDSRTLWSLALRHASPTIRDWVSRRLLDLSRIGGSYGNHHFLGWNWVRDRVSEYFVHMDGNVQLDMFVERTFFWNPEPVEKEFIYKNDWLGFVHTTPHRSPVYHHKGQNLYSLLEDANFLRSLECCRGLIVLSDSNRIFLESQLRKSGLDTPVFRLFHPRVPVNLDLADACTEEAREKIKKRVYHVGWHLRSFAPFARLAIDRARKVLLVPQNVSREEFLANVVNADLALAGLGPIDEHVAEIYTASQEEYQRILRWGVIFNHYIEPAASNLLSECISAESCLLINRHSAFEEYLGPQFPLFFDTPTEANELAGRLEDPSFRGTVRTYLRDLRDRHSMNQFCRELERVAERIYM